MDSKNNLKDVFEIEQQLGINQQDRYHNSKKGKAQYNKVFKNSNKYLSFDTLYEFYREKYCGSPKHDYSHFIRTMYRIKHHREIVRPMIKTKKKK